MDKIVAAIGELFYSYANQPCQSVTKIEQSGSDRIYFRLSLDDKTYIATYNHNVKENKNLYQFQQNISVNWDYRYPEVYKVNDEVTAYLQQDLGSTSLLNKLEEHGHNEYVYGLL